MKFLKIFDKKPTGSSDYQSWIEAAELELSVKQAALEAEFRLGHWPTWNADLAKGVLSFSDGAGVRVIAAVQVIGTTGGADWRWAWANSHLPEQFVEDSFEARAFGDDNGIAELTQPSVAADDLNALGWRLSAATVRLVDGLGAYRGPTRTGAVFLLIKTIQPVATA